MARSPPAFLLGEGINALSVIRSLGRHGIPVHVFSALPDDVSYRSRYSHANRLHHGDDSQSIVDQLISSATQLGEMPALFFTSDEYLRLVSRHRGQLSGHFHLQVPPMDSVEAVTDKERFQHFTRKHELPAPLGGSPQTLPELERMMKDLQFPVVLKPSKSNRRLAEEFERHFCNHKMTRAESEDELVASWEKIRSHSRDVIIQEMIEGDDHLHYSYCAYRRPGVGEVFGLCVNKIRVLPIHGGVGCFLKVVQDAEMERIGKETLEALQYVGVGSVCLKRDSRTNRPQIHEVNGRLPQWHSIFQGCGIDLPYAMYCDMIGHTVALPSTVTNGGKWVSIELDLRAFLEYRSVKELTFSEWLSTYKGVKSCAEFAWDDWSPLLSVTRLIITKGLTRALGLKKNASGS